MRKITTRIVHFFIESKVIDETDDINEDGFYTGFMNMAWKY